MRYTLRIYRDGERIDTFSFTDPNEAPDAFAAKYLLTFWEEFDRAVLTDDAGTEVFAWKRSVLL